MYHINHPSTLPQVFDQCKTQVEATKAILILNEYDPESVAAVQGSSRPGKRKGVDVWSVSSRSASKSSLLQRAQCVPVCIAQGLVASFEDYKAAIDEYNNPAIADMLAPPVAAAPAAAARGAAPSAKLPKAVKFEATAVKYEAPAEAKAELAAKQKAIQGMDTAIKGKDKEIAQLTQKVQAQESALVQANKDKEATMEQIIEGAKAQGACMHLRLHWCPTLNLAIICFLASRNRSCRSTAGGARQLALAEHDIHQRRPLEQRPLGC